MIPNGHQNGDVALRKVAMVLSSVIRRNTDYAFRYGGEEFSLLLYGANRQTAEVLAKKVLDDVMALNIPHSKSPYEQLTVSIGIAMVENIERVEAAKIIRIADTALYAAKHNGRNCSVTEIYDSSQFL